MKDNFSFHVQTISPYLATSLISAIFLLRHLRATDQMEQIKHYLRQQVMELIIFLVICLLLTLARAPQNLVEGFNLMYQYLSRPVLTFLVGVGSMLVFGIIYLVAAFIGLIENNKELRNLELMADSGIDRAFGWDSATKGVKIEWIRPFLISIVGW